MFSSMLQHPQNGPKTATIGRIFPALPLLQEAYVSKTKGWRLLQNIERLRNIEDMHHSRTC